MEVRVLFWAFKRREEKKAHGFAPVGRSVETVNRKPSFFLPPSCKKEKKVTDPDVAVAVKISRTVIAIGTWAPFV